MQAESYQKEPLEVFVNNDDGTKRVVGHACRDCGQFYSEKNYIHQNLPSDEAAVECCRPPKCSECGKRLEDRRPTRYSVQCSPCRDEENRLRNEERIDKAEKIPYPDFEFDGDTMLAEFDGDRFWSDFEEMAEDTFEWAYLDWRKEHPDEELTRARAREDILSKLPRWVHPTRAVRLADEDPEWILESVMENVLMEYHEGAWDMFDFEKMEDTKEALKACFEAQDIVSYWAITGKLVDLNGFWEEWIDDEFSG